MGGVDADIYAIVLGCGWWFSYIMFVVAVFLLHGVVGWNLQTTILYYRLRGCCVGIPLYDMFSRITRSLLIFVWQFHKSSFGYPAAANRTVTKQPECIPPPRLLSPATSHLRNFSSTNVKNVVNHHLTKRVSGRHAPTAKKQKIKERTNVPMRILSLVALLRKLGKEGNQTRETLTVNVSELNETPNAEPRPKQIAEM